MITDGEFSALITEAETGAEITIARHGRTPGDWGWAGPYDKSVFVPMPDEQAREEGWPL